MAVLKVDELFEGRGGQWTADQGRKWNRTFRVLTNAVTDGPRTAIVAVGISIGDQYIPSSNSVEWDLDAYATQITATNEEGDQLGWIVTVEYSWFSANIAGGGAYQNPLAMPIDVSWSFRNQEIVAEYDNNGNAVLNTANDPFDPPLVIDDPRPLLTVVRNEPTYNIPLVYQYRNAVNADSFAGFDPAMARVIQISGKSAFHQDAGWYWAVTYEFEFNPPLGYQPQVLNMGMRKISQTTNQPVPIILNGLPITKPMLLTKAGNLAKPTDPPYFIQFTMYPSLPFSVFQFDELALTGQRTGSNTGSG
jgi:hypothetical protein